MTVLDAKIKIVDYLVEHQDKQDSISFNQLNSLIDTTANKDECLVAILGALTEMVNSNTLYLNPLSDVSKPETLLWVTKQPLFLREQSLKLSGGICAQISGIVNEFFENIEADDFCDPLEISERDISVLIDLIGMLSSSDNDEENNKEEPPELPLKPEKPPKNK